MIRTGRPMASMMLTSSVTSRFWLLTSSKPRRSSSGRMTCRQRRGAGATQCGQVWEKCDSKDLLCLKRLCHCASKPTHTKMEFLQVSGDPPWPGICL